MPESSIEDVYEGFKGYEESEGRRYIVLSNGCRILDTDTAPGRYQAKDGEYQDAVQLLTQGGGSPNAPLGMTLLLVSGHAGKGSFVTIAHPTVMVSIDGSSVVLEMPNVEDTVSMPARLTRLISNVQDEVKLGCGIHSTVGELVGQCSSSEERYGQVLQDIAGRAMMNTLNPSVAREFKRSATSADD